MGGDTFRDLIAKIMSRRGYQVTLMPHSGDLGVDLTAKKWWTKIAIQTKRKSSKVPRTAVSDAVAGMAAYGCNKSMVVTNNYFTKGAIKLAKANKCTLIDHEGLRKWL